MNHLLAQLPQGITPDTNVTVPLTALWVILGAAFVFTGILIRAVWIIANTLRDLRDGLVRLEGNFRETWTRRDQEKWAAELERRNRKLPLHVPALPKEEAE